jgi:hypothetical protein
MPAPTRCLLLALTASFACAVPAGAVIPAPEGTQFAYLSTGPGSNGGGSTGEDLNGDGDEESDVAYLSLTFGSESAGTLGFQWDLLTGEVSGGVSDFFRVLLDGVEVLAHSVLTGSDDPLPPPGLSGFTGGPLLASDGSFFEDGRLGFASFSTALGVGSHTLDFFVYDDEDDIVDTALLLDALSLDGTVIYGFEEDAIGLPPGGPLVEDMLGNVRVMGESSFEQLVPEPAAAWLLGPALLALARRRRG